MWKCPQCQSYRDDGCEKCPSCGRPAPPADETPAPVAEAESLYPDPEPYPGPEEPEPSVFLGKVRGVDVKSQWSKKGLEFGCLLGFSLPFAFGVVSLVITVAEHVFGKPRPGEFSTAFELMVLGLVYGPLGALGGACLALVLEFLLKTTWGLFSRRPGGNIPAGSHHRHLLRRLSQESKPEDDRGRRTSAILPEPPPDTPDLRVQEGKQTHPLSAPDEEGRE